MNALWWVLLLAVWCGYHFGYRWLLKLYRSRIAELEADLERSQNKRRELNQAAEDLRNELKAAKAD